MTKKTGIIRFTGILVVIAAIALVIWLMNGKDQDTDIPQTADMDIKQLVEFYSANQTFKGSASITSEELIVTHENGRKEVYELPEDEFFVSIAPYVEQTHPCAIHSLTGCRGELAGEEFDVYIEDSEGTVIVNEKMVSTQNGFIDLWLPRDKTYQVKIQYGEKSAVSELKTFAGDDTCITTMQLAG